MLQENREGAVNGMGLEKLASMGRKVLPLKKCGAVIDSKEERKATKKGTAAKKTTAKKTTRKKTTTTEK